MEGLAKSVGRHLDAFGERLGTLESLGGPLEALRASKVPNPTDVEAFERALLETLQSLHGFEGPPHRPSKA